jgi:hypothetical protein
MKVLATALFAGFMAVGTAACAKEEPKKEAVQVAQAAPAAAPAAPAKPAQPETKKVCVDIQGKDGKPVIDPKTKQPKQSCTVVKVRQKFEGTKIEDAKKK